MDDPKAINKFEPPSIFIQYKGTTICCDLYCLCGHSGHYDGDFLYTYACPECGRIYKLDDEIKMMELDRSKMTQEELDFVKTDTC